MVNNLTIPQSFTTTVANAHYHKPFTRRIYYNDCVVMVTNCSNCGEELRRWFIEESNGQLNISVSTSCPIGVKDNIEIS